MAKFFAPSIFSFRERKKKQENRWSGRTFVVEEEEEEDEDDGHKRFITDEYTIGLSGNW